MLNALILPTPSGMSKTLSNKNFLRHIIIVTALVFRMTFFPALSSAQFILSGDFDVKLVHLNIRRTIPDTLTNQAVSFLGSAELDLEYAHHRWSAFLAAGATYTKGTSLYTTGVPAETSLNFYQAWVRYRFTKNFSLQLGRIEIDYDEGRFFQARDWSNLVTSHNAIIAHYVAPDSGLWTDMGFAANRFNQVYAVFSTSPSLNGYRYMAYWYFLKKLFDDQLTLNFTDIFNADDNGINPSVLYGRNTVGGSAWLAWPKWDLNLAGYYQFGHITDGRRLSAFYYAGYFSFHPLEWFSLMPAFEHLSGDNIADSASWKHVVHGFSLLYGNVNNSFGQSGLFYTMRSNLHPATNNMYFKATFLLSEKLSIEGTYHWITIPDHYRYEINSDSSAIVLVKVPPTLMQEGDIKITWLPLKTLEINLFYSLIFPGPGMKNYNGWGFNQNKPVSYSYLEIEWTPVIYPFRKKKHSMLPPS
jgi:hypothetical protein